MRMMFVAALVLTAACGSTPQTPPQITETPPAVTVATAEPTPVPVAAVVEAPVASVEAPLAYPVVSETGQKSLVVGQWVFAPEMDMLTDTQLFLATGRATTEEGNIYEYRLTYACADGALKYSKSRLTAFDANGEPRMIPFQTEFNQYSNRVVEFAPIRVRYDDGAPFEASLFPVANFMNAGALALSSDDIRPSAAKTRIIMSTPLTEQVLFETTTLVDVVERFGRLRCPAKVQ